MDLPELSQRLREHGIEFIRFEQVCNEGGDGSSLSRTFRSHAKRDLSDVVQGNWQ